MTLNELIKIVNEMATDPENLDLKIYFDDGIGCFEINYANVCQMGMISMTNPPKMASFFLSKF